MLVVGYCWEVPLGKGNLLINVRTIKVFFSPLFDSFPLCRKVLCFIGTLMLPFDCHVFCASA